MRCTMTDDHLEGSHRNIAALRVHHVAVAYGWKLEFSSGADLVESMCIATLKPIDEARGADRARRAYALSRATELCTAMDMLPVDTPFGDQPEAAWVWTQDNVMSRSTFGRIAWTAFQEAGALRADQGDWHNLPESIRRRWETCAIVVLNAIADLVAGFTTTKLIAKYGSCGKLPLLAFNIFGLARGDAPELADWNTLRDQATWQPDDPIAAPWFAVTAAIESAMTGLETLYICRTYQCGATWIQDGATKEPCPYCLRITHQVTLPEVDPPTLGESLGAIAHRAHRQARGCKTVGYSGVSSLLKKRWETAAYAVLCALEDIEAETAEAFTKRYGFAPSSFPRVAFEAYGSGAGTHVQGLTEPVSWPQHRTIISWTNRNQAGCAPWQAVVNAIECATGLNHCTIDCDCGATWAAVAATEEEVQQIPCPICGELGEEP